MARGLSIARKLSYAFGAGFAIAIITALVGVHAVDGTRRSVEVTVQRIAAAAAVASGVRSIQLAEDRYLTTGEDDDLAGVHQSCEALARGATDFEKLVDDASTRSAIGRVRGLSAQFCDEVDTQARAMSGEDAADDPDALQAIVKRRSILAADLNRASAELFDAEVARDAPQVLGSFGRLVALFAGMAAAMLAGFGFTWWLGRGVVSGLTDIVHEIREIAHSSRLDRCLSIRWNSAPDDEIGQLARAFNAMAEAVGARQEHLE